MKNTFLSFLLAIIASLCVSGIITTELGLVFLGISYSLPIGIIQNSAFVISALASLAFFIWFSLIAYKAEKKLMLETNT